MNPLPKEQHNRLVELVAKRFFNRIELYELYLWLDNFEPDEYEMAITILEHVDFYREMDFVSLIKSAIQKLPLDIKTACFHFVPIGKPGKSGDIVLYQLQKVFAPHTNKAHFYNYVDEIPTNQLCQDDYIVLVDDFIGSGNTVDEFIQNIPDKTVLLSYPRLCVLCGILMQSGQSYIERKYTKNYGLTLVAGDVKQKAFEKSHSPFGGYVRMKRIRDFCYKYGLELYKRGPLGFKNTQSLVIIEHSSPNDSLPILWSDNRYKNRKWIPLAPRNYSISIEKVCSERQDNNRWISMLMHKVGVERKEDIKRMFSGDNYTLIMMLRLLMEKKTESVIANTLGLSVSDMQSLKSIGINRNYWNEDWEICDFTKQQYTEAVAYALRKNREKESVMSERSDDRNMIYVPETFRGLK